MVEGNSLRSISRITGASITTVSKLLVDVGRACAIFHHDKVVDVNAQTIQCDEIWSFVYSKDKNVDRNKKNVHGAGDAWTWTAIDADTKLAISYFVGSRDANSANEFMHDVASRLRNRVQLTTDGHTAYLRAIQNSFGSDIDYAQLIKIYGSPDGAANDKRYSPAECISTETRKVSGDPDLSLVSTSYVERQNLTMRMSIRRFTRLTNAFSKKIENHFFAIAIHFAYYNFVRVHQSLKTAPAVAAGLIKKPMTVEDIVNLTEKYK